MPSMLRFVRIMIDLPRYVQGWVVTRLAEDATTRLAEDGTTRKTEGTY